MEISTTTMLDLGMYLGTGVALTLIIPMVLCFLGLLFFAFTTLTLLRAKNII